MQSLRLSEVVFWLLFSRAHKRFVGEGRAHRERVGTHPTAPRDRWSHDAAAPLRARVRDALAGKRQTRVALERPWQGVKKVFQFAWPTAQVNGDQPRLAWRSTPLRGDAQQNLLLPPPFYSSASIYHIALEHMRAQHASQLQRTLAGKQHIRFNFSRVLRECCLRDRERQRVLCVCVLREIRTVGCARH